MDFFAAHSIYFLLGVLFFPRITVWFFSDVIGGKFFWPGFMLFPRAYCAVLGVLYYWETNPILCSFAVLAAAIGEPLEKFIWKKLVSCNCNNCCQCDCCSSAK